MREIKRERLLTEGAIAGAVAGASFAAAEILTAAVAGIKPGAPWELSASILMGREAVRGILVWGTFFVGAVVHFGLSIGFGILFALMVGALPNRIRQAYGPMLFLGALYGAAIWVINFQIVGRLAFPWFLYSSGAVQFFIHVLAFGVPMAYWLALRIRDVEVPGVHRQRHALQTSSGEEEVGHLRRDLLVGRQSIDRPGVHD